MLPGWQRILQPHIDAGRLVAVGVVQEQHPERTLLYRQWRQLGWPILVDSLNLLDLSVVPVIVAIDEAGIVRHTRLRNGKALEELLAGEAGEGAGGAEKAAGGAERVARPDLDGLRGRAEKDPTARAWRDLADAVFLLGGEAGLDEAVAAYQRTLEVDPTDARAHFRLGVALRRRHEGGGRRPGDGQAAVREWGEALALNPNQYIWRRRIQQYGPSLDKPYNFYSWVAEARREIRARGEEPVALAVEPMGSELLPPRRRAAPDVAVSMPEDPDPKGAIERDREGRVAVESIVAPARVRPGDRVRVRLSFRLAGKTPPWWNNEGDPLRLWVDLPESLVLEGGIFVHPAPEKPETRELRVLEFEAQVKRATADGSLRIPAHAIYGICDDIGGACRFLRQDLQVEVRVDRGATRIQ